MQAVACPGYLLAMALTPPAGDALDQLEYEDRAINQLLDDLEDPRADRNDHGQAAKLFVEHLAVREAAREYVAEALRRERGLTEVGDTMLRATERRRRELGHLDELGRGIQPINLDQGQDFTAAIEAIKADLRREIGTELRETVPLIRQRLPERSRAKLLPSARYVRKHAPTHPGAHKRRWYERFGPFVRAHAIYDFLRGFPTGGPGPSREIDLPPQDNLPL